MPVAYIQEFEVEEGGSRSTENYDAVNARLQVQSNPPEGLIMHAAGFDEQDGVFRIFDVWETEEQAQKFMAERLTPIVQDVMASAGESARPPDREGFYELHHVVGAGVGIH